MTLSVARHHEPVLANRFAQPVSPELQNMLRYLLVAFCSRRVRYIVVWHWVAEYRDKEVECAYRQKQRSHRRRRPFSAPCSATLTTGPRITVAPGEGEPSSRRGPKQRQMSGKVCFYMYKSMPYCRLPSLSCLRLLPLPQLALA